MKHEKTEQLLAVIATFILMLLPSTAWAARATHTGFETATLEAGKTETVTGQTCAIETGIVHSGNYAAKCPAGGTRLIGITSVGSYTFAYIFPEVRETYGRVYVYIPNEPTAARIIVNDFANGGAIRLNTDRTISATVVGTNFTYQTSSIPIPLGAWARLEVHVKQASTMSSADGVIEAQLDGNQILAAYNVQTSRSQMDAAQAADWDIGPQGGDLGTDIYFDDIALNEVSGNVNNAWPGAGQIALVSLSGDVLTNWSVLNGSSHFMSLIDMPPDDAISYIFTKSKVLNLTDRWAFSVPSIPDNAIVSGICFGVRGGGVSRTGQQATAKFQAKDGAGNIVDGRNINWNVNGWGAVYPILVRDQTWQPLPGSLTKSYLSNIFGAAVLTSTSGKEIRWSSVWASIDYTP